MKAKKSISDDIRGEIELRAYYIWEREGRPEGRQHEHWALAQAEILSEQPVKKASAAKKSAKSAPAEKMAAAAAKPDAHDGAAKKNGAAAVVAAKAKKASKPKAGKSLPRES